MSQSKLLATHEWRPAGTDAGAAAPVAVLVHGITGWWRTWWRVGPALADRGWRVIAVDLRGHGTSPRIDGVATAESLADDVAATIEALAVAPVDVRSSAIRSGAAGGWLMDAHAFDAPTSRDARFSRSRPRRLARRIWSSSNLERETLAAREDPEAEAGPRAGREPDLD